MVVQKQYTLSRNHTSNVKFWSLPELAVCMGYDILCPGRQQWSPAPSQPHDLKGKQSIYFQLFGFSLSVRYSITHMRLSTVHYKIGIVLDDSAWL